MPVGAVERRDGADDARQPVAGKERQALETAGGEDDALGGDGNDAGGDLTVVDSDLMGAGGRAREGENLGILAVLFA